MKGVKTQISKIKFFYYKVALVLTIAVMAATVFQLPQIFIHSANKDMKQVIKDVSSTETLVVENELSVKTTVLPLADNQLQVTLDVVSELPTTSLENDQFILLVDQSASMNEYQETYETAIEVFKQSVAEKSNETAQIQEMYYNVATPELENQFSTLTEAISSLSALFSEGDASKKHVLLVTDSVLNDEIQTTEVTVSEEEIQARMPEVIEVPEIVVTEEQIQAKMPEVIEVPEVTISEGEEIDVEARQAELQQEAYDQAYALATEAAKQEAYNQAYEAAYQEAYQLATEQAKLEKSMTVNQEVYENMVQEFNQSLTELSELTKDSDLSILALPNKAREVQLDYQTITQIEMTDLSELEAKLMEWVSTFEHTQTFNQFNLNYEVSSLFKIVENSLTSTVEGVTIDNSYVNVNLQENIPTTMTLSFTVELQNNETEVNESVTLTNAANVSYQLAEGDLKTSDIPTTDIKIETVVTEIRDQNNNEVNSSIDDGEESDIVLGENFPSLYTNSGIIQGTLTTDKTATPWENDKSTIEFNITGTPEGERYTADIVLVFDTSSSMDKTVTVTENNNEVQKTLLRVAKDAAKQFCADLLKNSSEFVKISIVTFNTNAQIKNGLSNELDELQATIEGLTTSIGTNTQGGIRKAAEVLSGSTATNQYVLLFTDGLPSVYYKTDGSTSSIKEDDNAIKAAQKEFYTHFSHYDKTLTSIKIGGIVAPDTQEDWTVNNNCTYPDAQFYSIGIVAQKVDKAKAVLKSVQNTVNPNNYNLVSDKADDMNKIFNDVVDSIKLHMRETIATNAVLTDEVAKEFTIIENTIKVIDATTGADLTQQYKDKIVITKANETNDCDVITITIGDIPKTGLIVKFDIEARNDYLAGGGLLTNGPAKLEYTQNDEDEEFIYESPTVNIPPKVGTITVTKLVEGGNPQSDDDRFSVTMKGAKETYTVDLAASETQTLTFYMRDEDTPIELNEAYTDNNYLMVGEYEVSELLPANYEFKGITINDEQNKEKFMIDKDNDEIFIIVTNELVNENYWYDQTNRQNEFKYEYTPSPENPSVDK